MGAAGEINLSLPKAFPTSKITSVKSSLLQTLNNFEGLVSEYEELHLENLKYRDSYLSLKEKYESQTCKSCDDLKRHILTEKEVLDSVVASLNKLSETRDFNILDQIFKIINREIAPSPMDDNKSGKELLSPKKELSDSIVYEESLSEIEGTPGRRSPIIQSKKIKIVSSYSLSLNEKKKCPDFWPTPEKKSIKLSFPTPTKTKPSPSGRLKQARLNLVRMKTTSVVDLTCSPEAGRGSSEADVPQGNIKKEFLENDDTILPSPTSGPVVQLPTVYKSISKDSPSKFKKPSFDFKRKIEVDKNCNAENVPFAKDTFKKEVEDSINLLQQYPNRFKSPVKVSSQNDTNCPDESISLLQHVKKLEEKNKITSPRKNPLAVNVNLDNIQKQPETQSSMSILQQEIFPDLKNEIYKKMRNNIEPVYKEPAVRKKAEKRALPGWSCEECRVFYDELYRGDSDMLAKKMDECSKHRGRSNPARPRTPDGFWNVRWHVPADTEEFNRRNDAL